MSVRQSDQNVAMEALGRTREGDVLLDITNLGSSGQDRKVELRADGRLVDILPLRFEATSSIERIWTGLPLGPAF